MNNFKLCLVTTLCIFGVTSSLNAQNRQLSPQRPTDGNRETIQQRMKPSRTAPRRMTARPKVRPPLDRINPSVRQRKKLKGTTDVMTPKRIKPNKRTMKRVNPPLDDFPYQAQDFGNNERIFRGKKYIIQKIQPQPGNNLLMISVPAKNNPMIHGGIPNQRSTGRTRKTPTTIFTENLSTR